MTTAAQQKIIERLKSGSRILWTEGVGTTPGRYEWDDGDRPDFRVIRRLWDDGVIYCSDPDCHELTLASKEI